MLMFFYLFEWEIQAGNDIFSVKELIWFKIESIQLEIDF